MNEWLAASKYKNIWSLTDTLIAQLVAPEHRKLQELIDRLTVRNAELIGKPVFAFTQNGLIYKHSAMRIQPTGIDWRPTLSFYLANDFEEYNKQVTALSNEKAVMRQTLALMYHPTENLQELRDSTPEYLVHFIEEFKGIPRQQDVLALVSDNERLVRQFTKTENLMKLHAAGHLLY